MTCHTWGVGASILAVSRRVRLGTIGGAHGDTHGAEHDYHLLPRDSCNIGPRLQHDKPVAREAYCAYLAYRHDTRIDRDRIVLVRGHDGASDVWVSRGAEAGDTATPCPDMVGRGVNIHKLVVVGPCDVAPLPGKAGEEHTRTVMAEKEEGECNTILRPKMAVVEGDHVDHDGRVEGGLGVHECGQVVLVVLVVHEVVVAEEAYGEALAYLVAEAGEEEGGDAQVVRQEVAVRDVHDDLADHDVLEDLEDLGEVVDQDAFRVHGGQTYLDLDLIPVGAHDPDHDDVHGREGEGEGVCPKVAGRAVRLRY